MTERATRLAQSRMIPELSVWRYKLRMGDWNERDVYALLQGTEEESNLTLPDVYWLMKSAMESRSPGHFARIINDYIADFYGKTQSNPPPTDDPGA